MPALLSLDPVVKCRIHKEEDDLKSDHQQSKHGEDKQQLKDHVSNVRESEIVPDDLQRCRCLVYDDYPKWKIKY